MIFLFLLLEPFIEKEITRHSKRSREDRLKLKQVKYFKYKKAYGFGHLLDLLD